LARFEPLICLYIKRKKFTNLVFPFVQVEPPVEQQKQHPEPDDSKATKATKSWASLFHSESGSNSDGGRTDKPIAMIYPFNGDPVSFL
jgi:hypothetical protein